MIELTYDFRTTTIVISIYYQFLLVFAIRPRHKYIIFITYAIFDLRLLFGRQKGLSIHLAKWSPIIYLLYLHFN